MNLYVVGGAVVGAILYTIAVFFYGEHVESLAWTAKVAEMNQQMATAKSAHDIAIADLNAKLEKEHSDALASLGAKQGALDSLAADLDRLRAKSRSCGGDQVRPAPVPQGSAPGNGGKPPGAVPSLDGSFAELNALMKQCFAVAAYAELGHKWATDPAVSK